LLFKELLGSGTASGQRVTVTAVLWLVLIEHLSDHKERVKNFGIETGLDHVDGLFGRLFLLRRVCREFILKHFFLAS
jgi:hypothetical protein